MNFTPTINPAQRPDQRTRIDKATTDSSAAKCGTEGRLEFLDAMRGWAILGVLAVHTSQTVPGLPPLLGRICERGQHGVQLFFIVSALTLMLSLGRRGKEPLSMFFVRRVCRILPMYLLGCLFYLVWSHLTGHGMAKKAGIAQVVMSLTFTNGWLPSTISVLPPGGWSVTDEMTFYLLFPLLFTYVRSARFSLILICAVAIFAATAKMLLTSDWFSEVMLPLLGKSLSDCPKPLADKFFYYWFPNQLPVFLTGILAYHLYRRQWASPSHRAGWLLLLAGGAGVATILLPLPLELRSLAAAAAFLCLVLSCSAHPWRGLVNKATRYIGLVSFSMYLTHFFLLDVVKSAIWRLDFVGFWPKEPFGQITLTFAALVGLTVAVSSVSYRLVEAPGIAFGRHLVIGIKQRAASRLGASALDYTGRKA